jgi:hypothetical protein
MAAFPVTVLVLLVVLDQVYGVPVWTHLWALFLACAPTLLDHLLQELRYKRKKSGPTPSKGDRTPARNDGDE